MRDQPLKEISKRKGFIDDDDDDDDATSAADNNDGVEKGKEKQKAIRKHLYIRVHRPSLLIEK